MQLFQSMWVWHTRAIWPSISLSLPVTSGHFRHVRSLPSLHFLLFTPVTLQGTLKLLKAFMVKSSLWIGRMPLSFSWHIPFLNGRLDDLVSVGWRIPTSPQLHCPLLQAIFLGSQIQSSGMYFFHQKKIILLIVLGENGRFWIITIRIKLHSNGNNLKSQLFPKPIDLIKTVWKKNMFVWSLSTYG